MSLCGKGKQNVLFISSIGLIRRTKEEEHYNLEHTMIQRKHRTGYLCVGNWRWVFATQEWRKFPFPVVAPSPEAKADYDEEEEDVDCELYWFSNQHHRWLWPEIGTCSLSWGNIFAFPIYPANSSSFLLCLLCFFNICSS